MWKWKMPHQEVVPPQPSGQLVWTLIATMVRAPPLHERSTLNNLFSLNNHLNPLNCPPNCPINEQPGLCPIWPLAPFENTTTSLNYPTC